MVIQSFTAVRVLSQHLSHCILPTAPRKGNYYQLHFAANESAQKVRCRVTCQEVAELEFELKFACPSAVPTY